MRIVPPAALSSGLDVLPSSEMIKSFPRGLQLANCDVGLPPEPTPGPPPLQYPFGEPRSESPPVGFALSKIIRGLVAALFVQKVT
jgi:hypothetical protein